MCWSVLVKACRIVTQNLLLRLLSGRNGEELYYSHSWGDKFKPQGKISKIKEMVGQGIGICGLEKQDFRKSSSSLSCFVSSERGL